MKVESVETVRGEISRLINTLRLQTKAAAQTRKRLAELIDQIEARPKRVSCEQLRTTLAGIADNDPEATP